MRKYGAEEIFEFTQADSERLIKSAQWMDQNMRLNIEKRYKPYVKISPAYVKMESS